MSIFEDAWDWAVTTVSDPTNWIRAITLMGWPGYLASLLPGPLAITAQRTLDALPGLVKGEDFSTAWLNEFAWRLEKYAYYTGITAAAGAAGGAITKLSAAQLTSAIEKAARSPATQLAVTAAIAKHPTLPKAEALRRENVTPEALAAAECAKAGADPALCRPDTHALAINYNAHAPIHNTVRDYDVRSGERISDLARYYPGGSWPQESGEARARWLTAADKLGPSARPTLALKHHYRGLLTREMTSAPLETMRRRARLQASRFDMNEAGIQAPIIIQQLDQAYEEALAAQRAGRPIPIAGSPPSAPARKTSEIYLDLLERGIREQRPANIIAALRKQYEDALLFEAAQAERQEQERVQEMARYEIASARSTEGRAQFVIAPASNVGALGQFLTAALLTLPAWGPLWAWPMIRRTWRRRSA